jgi:hypothetical protein
LSIKTQQNPLSFVFGRPHIITLAEIATNAIVASVNSVAAVAAAALLLLLLICII